MRQCVLLLTAVLLSMLTKSWAQCPAANSYAVSTTVASCPSNGAIQLQNPADSPVNGGMGVSGAIYTITAGPSSGGYQTTGQSANRFDGLPPGTYTITISKPGCPDILKTGVSIGSTYIPMTLAPAVTNLCAGGQAGGTITTTVTGGSAPLEYAFFLSGSANVADETLTYGPASSTIVTAFGTYQVRVRDACGTFVTRSVTVAPLYGKAYFNPSGTNKDCNTYSINGSLPLLAGGSVTPTQAGSYTIELFDVATTNPCAIPAGATPFQTIRATSANDLKFDLAKTHGTIVIRTTSPCGEVDVRCFNLGTTIGPSVSLLAAPSCGQANGTNAENVQIQFSRFTPPTSITITSRATGTPVLLTDSFANNATKLYTIPYVADGYNVQVLDNCNQLRTLTVNTPPSVGTPVSVAVSTNRTCANQLGSKRTVVTLTGGITGLLEPGSKVLLTEGPTGILTPNVPADGGSSNVYYWNNLEPGTYTASITSTTAGCGPTSFTFVVPANSASSPGLTYNLTGTVTQLCGGNATLTTSFSYNGPNSVTYVTTNSGGATIATNTTGFFGNLPPDVYTVQATANTGCGYTFTQSQSFTLTSADSNPTIVKKVGVVCESGGSPTATGQAYFQFTGFGPYRFEQQLAGSVAWTTVATGITSTLLTVTNLNANSIYNFRLTDNCGKSVVTTVSIKPLEAQRVENTLQPCLNSAYTLSVPDITGASYSWTKNGQVVSTDRQVIFSPYQAADNGTYTATIKLGNNCVVREVNATLNSANCNQPLPVSLVSFQAKPTTEQTVQVDWMTSLEVNNAYFLVQRSKDLRSFETLTRITDTERSGRAYHYTDTTPYAGTSYYRLQQVDVSGKVNSFPAVSVVLRQEAYGAYPNPVRESLVTVNLDEPATAKIVLYTAEGRALQLLRRTAQATQVTLQLPETLATGVYFLVVEERGNRKEYRLLVTK